MAVSSPLWLRVTCPVAAELDLDLDLDPERVRWSGRGWMEGAGRFYGLGRAGPRLVVQFYCLFIGKPYLREYWKHVPISEPEEDVDSRNTLYMLRN